MAEWSLEEQLARIRMLADQLSEATRSAADVSDELSQFRNAVKRGPLFDVRDYRIYLPELTAESCESPNPADSPNSARSSTPRESPSRRRRR